MRLKYRYLDLAPPAFAGRTYLRHKGDQIHGATYLDAQASIEMKRQ